MDLAAIALLVASGIAAGTVNAVAGGGSLLTFPALVAVGLPPVSANRHAWNKNRMTAAAARSVSPEAVPRVVQPKAIPAISMSSTATATWWRQRRRVDGCIARR